MTVRGLLAGSRSVSPAGIVATSSVTSYSPGSVTATDQRPVASLVAVRSPCGPTTLSDGADDGFSGCGAQRADDASGRRVRDARRRRRRDGPLRARRGGDEEQGHGREGEQEQGGDASGKWRHGGAAGVQDG